MMNKDERKRLEELQKDGEKSVGSYLLKNLNYLDLRLLLLEDETIRNLIRQICAASPNTEMGTLALAAPTEDDTQDDDTHNSKSSKKDELKDALKAAEKNVKSLTAEVKTLTTQLRAAQNETSTHQRQATQLSIQLQETERKLKTPATHPLVAQLSPELDLLKAVLTDEELRQTWNLMGNEDQGRQLARLIANVADWGDGVCTLWDKLATRCKKEQRPATGAEVAMLQTALDLHNLRYQTRAATLTTVETGIPFHHETMERGPAKGNTVTQNWLPGMNNAAGNPVKKPVVGLS